MDVYHSKITGIEYVNAAQQRLAFDFEKDAEWESKCDKRKIEEHINLLKAYRYATKLLRNYNKKYLSQNESKWRYKILKIWLNQDAGGKENLAEYGAKYLYILNKFTSLSPIPDTFHHQKLLYQY